MYDIHHLEASIYTKKDSLVNLKLINNYAKSNNAKILLFNYKKTLKKKFERSIESIFN